MSIISTNFFSYYAKPGQFTDLSKYKKLINNLPANNVALINATQNLIVHDMWLDHYDVKKDPKKYIGASRTAADIIDLSLIISKKKLFDEHNKNEKVIGDCRDFSIFLCALFRIKEIPARARCGFASYLAKESKYEDHWVCEVYRNNKWRKIDPQIDSFQLNFILKWAKEHPKADNDYKKMLLSLDPMDITEHHFITAGKAWKLSRDNSLNPNNFGIGINPEKFGLKSLSGLWFIRGNLIRDFLALNKIEVSPFVTGIENNKNYWHNWRLMNTEDSKLTDNDWALLDKISKLTDNPNYNLKEIRDLFAENPDLHPPFILNK